MLSEPFAERGNERREWIQVVTDTAENRAQNRVDELYEVVDGDRVLQANEGNADLLRLYAWTLPTCVPPVETLASEQREIVVGGQRFASECARQEMTCEGQRATMTTCESESFVWGNVYADVIANDGSSLWQVRVLRAGRAR